MREAVIMLTLTMLIFLISMSTVAIRYGVSTMIHSLHSGSDFHNDHI
jgi:hypothetical protein